MTWGPNIEVLHAHYSQTGEPPPALANKPEAGPDVSFFVECFLKLSKNRQSSGFGVNPLLYSDIADFAGRVGFVSNDEFLHFLDIIQELDDTFISLARERQKRQEELDKMKAKNRR